MPPVRRLSNTLGGWVFSAAVGRKVADNQSGYRLIGRQLMTALLDSDESGFEFEVEMIARCIALGLPIAGVPIRTIYAGEPSHIRPWRHFTSSCGSAATPGGSCAAAEPPSVFGRQRSRRNGTSATRMFGRPSSDCSIRRPFSL